MHITLFNLLLIPQKSKAMGILDLNTIDNLLSIVASTLIIWSMIQRVLKKKCRLKKPHF